MSIDHYSINNKDEEKPARVTPTPETRRPARRTSGGVWAVLIALALGLSALAYWDFSALSEHNIKLAQLPGLLDSMTGMSKRVDAAESKLSAWAADRDTLLSRVSQLQGKMNANAKLIQKQTQEWMVQAEARLQADREKHDQVIDARLSRFESEQQAEQVRLAKLQEDVSSVRQQVATVRGETGKELSSLSREQTESRAKLNAISNQLDRERIDFEVAKNETRDVAAGVSLHILKTDVSYQRYAGWINFLPDHRTMWIEDQGVQEPVVIRAKNGGEPFEIVVTGIQKHGVTGYMLVPVSGSAHGSKESAAVDDGNVEASVRPGV